ncbi:MAG: molybdopterin-binding protein [Velocimicrobium sp.]
MKLINTVDAVGHVLCHDITQIIKDEKKERVFKKGHIVTKEDIPILLSVGKDHLYIWEKEEGFLHENEGATRLYALCENDSIYPSQEIKEGKIEAFAAKDGFLQIDVEKLNQVNMLDEIMIATRHNNQVVKKGEKLAGMRVIPLTIEEKKLQQAEKLVGETPLFYVKEFHKKKVGIVTTGNEVFLGRIKDTFGPVIQDKLKEFPTKILGQTIVNDELDMIKDAILDFIYKGADMVVCTGGMSVDPDDMTPGAIRATGARIVSYGAPVLPGAMMLVSYYNGTIPVVGLPGCVMYAKRTIFDIVLPRLMADIPVTKKDLARLGHGGLCLSCDVCTFPNCGFGAAGQ